MKKGTLLKNKKIMNVFADGGYKFIGIVKENMIVVYLKPDILYGNNYSVCFNGEQIVSVMNDNLEKL